MKHKIKKTLKTIKKFFKRVFSKKIPVYCPVMYGDLLKGRVALITGGGSGIGLAIAKSFINNGASVIITGRNKKKLENAVETLKIEGSKTNSFIKFYCLDISNIDKNVLNKILQENKIDILVNNAGISRGRNIGDTLEKDFDEVINTNVKGTYFISQEIFNYFKNNNIKGNILNVLSASAQRPVISPYCLSKWSLLGLTKGLAKKGIEHGIVVNGIAPGPTSTQMLPDSFDNLDLPKLPAERYTLPEEIANISTILVSDLGKMIIGDTIFITGGAAIVTYDDIDY